MNICYFLSSVIKYLKGRLQICRVTTLLNRCSKFISALLIIAFGAGNIYAQHLFSVNYNELSQENARRVREQVTRSIGLPAPLTRDTKGEYDVSLSTVQNTKIIILNEETGNNVVVTPAKEAPAQFRLQPFFIEELRRSALGDAKRYLIIEAEADFSVRSVASVVKATEKVFVPRYFYGPKEDVKEALPKDRQIINIFKEKPGIIPAFPNDPENLRYVAQLEEDMSYYVYMYKMPDGSLYIFDENFIDPNVGKNQIIANIGTNLPFIFTDSLLNTQQRDVTEHAIKLWSELLAGTVPVGIHITFESMSSNALGASYVLPHYWNSADSTWYPSALGNQLADTNIAPDMINIRLVMNSNHIWNFSITDYPEWYQFDWLSVMLHEIAHGLGFAASVRRDGSFAFALINGTNFPGIFDRQLYEGTTGPNFVDITQSQRAILIESDNMFAGRPGSYLLAANDGVRVKIASNPPWTSGSSLHHWDHNVDFETFMKSGTLPGSRRAVIGEREVAIMRDIGWGCPTTINFTDRTVDRSTTIISCGTINTQNTTVTQFGTLNLKAPNSINIGPGFTVQQGGSLTIEVR